MLPSSLSQSLYYLIFSTSSHSLRERHRFVSPLHFFVYSFCPSVASLVIISVLLFGLTTQASYFNFFKKGTCYSEKCRPHLPTLLSSLVDKTFGPSSRISAVQPVTLRISSLLQFHLIFIFVSLSFSLCGTLSPCISVFLRSSTLSLP